MVYVAASFVNLLRRISIINVINDAACVGHGAEKACSSMAACLTANGDQGPA